MAPVVLSRFRAAGAEVRRTTWSDRADRPAPGRAVRSMPGSFCLDTRRPVARTRLRAADALADPAREGPPERAGIGDVQVAGARHGRDEQQDERGPLHGLVFGDARGQFARLMGPGDVRADQDARPLVAVSAIHCWHWRSLLTWLLGRADLGLVFRMQTTGVWQVPTTCRCTSCCTALTLMLDGTQVTGRPISSGKPGLDGLPGRCGRYRAGTG